MPSAGQLASASDAWRAYRLQDPQDGLRIQRQAAYFLVMPGRTPEFLPLRFMLAWLQGTPFSQKGGRSIDMKDHFAVLAELGLARVAERTMFFAATFATYEARCVAQGGAPSNYIGTDPRTGRVFWVAPYAF